jgi:hypothetical protein
MATVGAAIALKTVVAEGIAAAVVMPRITAALLAEVAPELTAQVKRMPTRTTPEKLMQTQPTQEQPTQMQRTQLRLLVPAHPAPQQHMRAAVAVDMQAAVAVDTRAAEKGNRRRSNSQRLVREAAEHTSSAVLAFARNTRERQHPSAYVCSVSFACYFREPQSIIPEANSVGGRTNNDQASPGNAACSLE